MFAKWGFSGAAVVAAMALSSSPVDAGGPHGYGYGPYPYGPVGPQHHHYHHPQVRPYPPVYGYYPPVRPVYPQPVYVPAYPRPCHTGPAYGVPYGVGYSRGFGVSTNDFSLWLGR
jgi:hypothetical protein